MSGPVESRQYQTFCPLEGEERETWWRGAQEKVQEVLDTWWRWCPCWGPEEGVMITNC